MATFSGTQYSGMWTLQQVHDAVSNSTWPDGSPGYLYAAGDGNYSLGLNNTQSKRSMVRQTGTGTANWKLVTSNKPSNPITLGIKSDGSLWGWNYNVYGQLGTNDTITRSSPTQVGSSYDWSTVSAGNQFTHAIKTNGTLWGWGYSQYGQIGDSTIIDRSSPVQIGALTTWASVSSGVSAVAAIKTDGTLWAWGYNFNGQLGQNNTTNFSSPVQVGALTTWSQVAMQNHVIALKTDGTLWSWGAGSSGKLGLGNTTDYSSPKQIGALTNWGRLGKGNASNSWATTTAGALYGWGNNSAGILGDGTETARNSPVQVGALTTWVSAETGDGPHTVALKTDGTAWVWGSGDYGQLGYGYAIAQNFLSPIQLGSKTGWLQIVAGYRMTYGISSDLYQN